MKPLVLWSLSFNEYENTYSDTIINFFSMLQTILYITISLVGLFLFYLILISTIPFIIVYYYIIEIFLYVFGEEWIEAGKFFQVLIYHSYWMLLSRPFISAIPVLNLNKEFFIIEIFSVFIRKTSFLTAFFLFLVKKPLFFTKCL